MFFDVKKTGPIFNRVFGKSLGPYRKRNKLVDGFNEVELADVEKQLGLSISGEFRDYMKELGKCSGVFLDGKDFYNLDGLRYWHDRIKSKFLEHTPDLESDGVFVFDDCSQAVTFSFLNTKSKFPNLVYYLDPEDKENEVYSGGLSFLDYQARRFQGSVESLRRSR